MRHFRFYACIPAAACLALMTASCAAPGGPGNVSSNQVGVAQPVAFGTVQSVRPVEIHPGQTRTGTVVGAALGGIGGSQIGGGTAANVAGGIGGAVVGGILGSAAQNAVGTRQGLEITVQLDNGPAVAVVQEGAAGSFLIGDRVRVSGSGSNTRVSH